jgi:formylglycine-generating enzyme required for sulfatase activity/metallophosphoesterase superfamily enzyme
MSTFQILHISDLHVSTDKDFDRKVVLDPLLDILREDVEKNLRPEIVVITGDLAWKGKKEEYAKAEEFLTDLRNVLRLGKEQFFIVPGNHDMDRDKYRPTDLPKYESMEKLNVELENEVYRVDLLKGFEDYFDFIKDNYPHLQPEHKRLIPFVYKHETKGGKQIGLVGLNSAWLSRTNPDIGKVAVGEFQIKNAFMLLKEMGKLDWVIYLFHHPLNWLWLNDKKICRTYVNYSGVLTGHFHETEGGYSQDNRGSYNPFYAGAVYLKSTRPNQFHYLTVDWLNHQILVDYRIFSPENRIWCVDNSVSKNGRKIFSLARRDVDERERSSVVEKNFDQEIEREEIIQKYRQSALEEHRYLPTKGFETNLRHPIAIEGVFINLKAAIHPYEIEPTLAGRGKMIQRINDEQLPLLDIKATFEVSQKQSIKDLVILGDPGAGKTTLLKYILVMLVEGRGLEKLSLPIDMIPFFAPLRDLKNPDNEPLLSFLIRTGNLDLYGIKAELLEEALEKQRCIILLDGLDEVADEEARVKTCQWIDRQRKRWVKTPFVITSRFAGYLGQSRLDGGCWEMAIQDLRLEEAEAFLRRWFETVEAAIHPGDDEKTWRAKGIRDAEKLIKVIREKDYLKALAVNPLMLQIIALVHKDRGELPKRRVELYEECTNVLLEKWDAAKGLDITITAKEARQILQPLAHWLHDVEGRRYAPLGEIAKVISGPLKDLGKKGVGPESLLLNIRDRSGIFMGHSEREYGFTHLSFQEYLAAEHIRNQKNISLLIEKYGEKWWREVILLSLSLANPSIMEPFLQAFIPTEKFKIDLSLIMNALKDSIIKPQKPFLDALSNTSLSSEAKENALRLIREIEHAGGIDVLEEVPSGEVNIISPEAFETRFTISAELDITRPVSEQLITIVNPKDGAPMVLIPAGTFLYGSREDDKKAWSNEKPQQVISLPDYYMDLYPVTNEQYAAFLNQTESFGKKLDEWIYLKGEFETERCLIKAKKNKYEVEKGYEKYPVIYVTWYGAQAYAEWAGKRLPKEQEWEKAARGPEGRTYPWGNRFEKAWCNSRESGKRGTTPVDYYQNGKSPYGCFDMAGNVWEWTSSLYGEGSDRYVLRGGSWGYDSGFCRCAARISSSPDGRNGLIGFRCARS